MCYLTAKFKNIETIDLYKMVEPLHLNVADMIEEVILYGEINLNQLRYVDYVCHKFGAFEITIRQQKEPE